MERINKLLNLSGKEWPRILVGWSMMFLTRFGFIIGWSVLIATFLTHVGIGHLPLLFLTNAILTMVGVVFFRQLVHKIRKEVLITFIVLSAAAFLLSATFFINTNAFIFFALLLVAESMLLAQLMILISLFNEDLFSPLESQRTFPIIESAETIGGIAGGLVLTFFANQLPGYKFIIIWAISLLLILPIVLRFNAKTMHVPALELKEIKEEAPQEKLGKSLREMKKAPFLKGLMIVVLLHWGMMNIVEFQYTKAIQQEVYSVQEETIVLNEHNPGLVLASEGLTDSQIAIYEQEITKKLGLLHVIFNAAALVIQLILASRIITSLGVVSSLLIHPLVTLLNLFGLSLRFGFVTAAITRGSFELTGLIFNNAYESSYYAIPHKKRSITKEVMQGIMKPLGAIIGTIAILLFAFSFTGTNQTLALNIMLIVMSLMMGGVIFKLSRRYTELSEQNLSKKMDIATRLNAIEILAQNGHEQTTPALQKILKRESEPEIVKVHILRTMGQRVEIDSINSILEILDEKNDRIRLEAVRALSKYKKIKDHSFSYYRVRDRLKELLLKEDNETIKEEVVDYFYEIAPRALTAYVLDSIKNIPSKRASFIRILKHFEDPNLQYYLEPYLEDKSPEIRASSIIALWRFKKLRGRLRHYLNQMLKSPKSSVLIAGIDVCGDVQLKEFKSTILPFLVHKDQDVQEATLLTLARMGDKMIVPHLVGCLVNPEHKWFHTTASILGRLPKRFKGHVQNALHKHIRDLIDEILVKTKQIENLEKETLDYLTHLYRKLNAHQEVQKLESIERVE